MLPPWFQPLADAVAGVRGEDLTRFLPPDDGGREAAVLILLGEGEAGPDLLLIERSHDMRSHAGQPAFPGGAVDDSDDDAVATALREAEEETGLDGRGVEIVATLPRLWLPPSGFVVTPVLGWWHTPSPVFAADPAEVAAAHRVPCVGARRSGEPVARPSSERLGRARLRGARHGRLGVHGWSARPAHRPRRVGAALGRRPGRGPALLRDARRPVTGFDWLVLALVPLMVYAGHRLGFLVSTLSFGGFVLGVVLGLAAAPRVAGGLEPGPGRAMAAFAVVLAAGMFCQAAGSFVGATLRDTLTGRLARGVDAALGATVALVALLAGTWLVGSAAGQADDLPFAASARDSRLVAALSASVPLDSDSVLATFATLVDRSGFPAVFGDAGLERIEPVPAADPAVLDEPGVRAAYPSLVKVLGVAPSCRRSFEGSGFVVAPGRVMTNAHVVAGTRQLDVYLVDSLRPYPAEVVVFDPATDVAVLDVPGLPAPALSFGPGLRRGDDAVVAGFPGDGPLAAYAGAGAQPDPGCGQGHLRS